MSCLGATQLPSPFHSLVHSSITRVATRLPVFAAVPAEYRFSGHMEDSALRADLVALVEESISLLDPAVQPACELHYICAALQSLAANEKKSGSHPLECMADGVSRSGVDLIDVVDLPYGPMVKMGVEIDG